MKKNIIKNFWVICIVFVFSINTLAVVISDNDGSGFITKPEFDSLKSSFQAQIDSFNNSIDNKIDTAIASYLDGIVLSDIDEYGIIMDWKNVLFINETKAPEFRLPNFVCMYGFTGESHVADTNLKIFSQGGKLFYKPTTQWATNETCRRPLFGVLS